MRYHFWGEGKSVAGFEQRIEFIFEDDELIEAIWDDTVLTPEDANFMFQLGEVYGPGYVPMGKPYSRLNALNFLRWGLFFDHEPEIGGDAGMFAINEIKHPKGVEF